MCLMMAILATLFLGDVDRVSAALGRSINFDDRGGVAVGAGVNGSKLFLGLLPSVPPSVSRAWLPCR